MEKVGNLFKLVFYGSHKLCILNVVIKNILGQEEK